MKTFFFHICEQRRISTYSSGQSRFVGIFYSLNNSTSGSVYGPDQTVQKFKVVWALISHNYMTKPFSCGIALTNMDNNSIRNNKTQ